MYPIQHLNRTGKIIIYALVFFLVKGSWGQLPTSVLPEFSAVLVDEQIRLNWIIAGGNTCEGIRIQRSADGLIYETIGEIAGICGSPDTDVSYVYFDPEPFLNQPNYYRIELGTQGYSRVISISYYRLNDQGFYLSADPDRNIVTIIYSNPGKEVTHYGLYNQEGKLLCKGDTREEKITLEMTSYSSRFYIFTINSLSQSVSGKFVYFCTK